MTSSKSSPQRTAGECRTWDHVPEGAPLGWTQHLKITGLGGCGESDRLRPPPGRYLVRKRYPWPPATRRGLQDHLQRVDQLLSRHTTQDIIYKDTVPTTDHRRTENCSSLSLGMISQGPSHGLAIGLSSHALPRSEQKKPRFGQLGKDVPQVCSTLHLERRGYC